MNLIKYHKVKQITIRFCCFCLTATVRDKETSSFADLRNFKVATLSSVLNNGRSTISGEPTITIYQGHVRWRRIWLWISNNTNENVPTNITQKNPKSFGVSDGMGGQEQ